MKYINWDGAEATGETWSPGPVPNSVWLVDGTCVRFEEKTNTWWEVRPPSLEEEIAAEQQSFRRTDRWDEYVVRYRYRHAPKLPRGLWNRATA